MAFPEMNVNEAVGFDFLLDSEMEEFFDSAQMQEPVEPVEGKILGADCLERVNQKSLRQIN